MAAVSEQAFRVLQQRVAAVETRLSEADSAFGETLYRLRRESIATRIELSRLLEQTGLSPATDEEIDTVLENES